MERIFIAVDVSEEVKKLMTGLAGELRAAFPKPRVSWEKPEKIHLTLRFLGEADGELLKKVKDGVRQAAAQSSKFRLMIKGTGVFPNKKRGKVLWVGIRDEEGFLAKLKMSLDRELELIGIEKEKRKFRPHLTLARLREPFRSGKLIEKHLAVDFEPVEFGVDGIVIYKSQLLPAGSVYKPISKNRFTN